MKKQIALITLLCFAQGVFSMEIEDKDAQLYAAADRGDYEEVSNLLEMGADANTTGPFEQPLLYGAALHGHTPVVELLLEKGADVDARDWGGITPLMIAAHKGHWHTVKLLLAAGAKVTTHNKNRTATPLIIAVRGGHTDVVKLLLDAGADMDATTFNGKTALMHAAEQGQAETVELLLTYIPAAESQYIRNSFTTLYALKVKKGTRLPRDVRNLLRDTIIAELVQRQMNRVVQLVNQRDAIGDTARDIALLNNHRTVYDLLDLNNPVSRERIRKQIENNIKRILFGEPQERPGVTRELTLEEVFGSWLREPESETQE